MLTKSEMNGINMLLMKASHDDMEQIASLFNDVRRLKAKQDTRKFSVGQKVKWVGRNGAIFGTVNKINQKNIIVDCGRIGMYRVNASILEAA